MANRFENKVRLLDLIREMGRISRPVLSETLGINLPTISNLTKELLDARLIVGDGFEKSDGGRRAELLSLNPRFATALGLELSLTGIRGVIAGLGGQVLQKEEVERVPERREEMIAALVALAERLIARIPEKPIGVGVSIAGLTDEGGRLSRKFPHREDWSDVPLARILEKRLGLPAILENDVQAATLAERRHGAARGARNILYLHIGRGIACGIVVEGRLYTGATRNAGEFGHTIVEPNGPLCHCGNYGCLESLASPGAVLEQTLQGVKKGVESKIASASSLANRAIAAEAVYRAADEGDRLAVNVVTRAGEYIGLGLANLVNLFNPELVVFGGEVLARGHKVLAETIERTFRARVLPIMQDKTRIETSRLGRDAAAIGGSLLIFEDLFDQPELLFAVAEGKTLRPLSDDEERAMLEQPGSSRLAGAPKKEGRSRRSDSERRRLAEGEQRTARWRRWAIGRAAAPRR